MFFPKVVFCRVFQGAFRAALPVLPYKEPKIIKSCSKLGVIVKKENIKSVLIVTDKGIITTGLVNPVVEALNANSIPYCIYADTQPNPTVHNVEDALKVYHSNKCNGIIAIGGGSAMDCAKAVGARVVYPKRSVNQLGGKLKVWRKLPTLIAISTTAGTGSETTLAAMITDSDTHRKYAIMSFPIIPHYAVLDATLTYSLPPHLTASTGVDALTHAVEAYIGRSTSKETRKLALEATRLIFENVETAYKDGNNHQARENMLHAAYKAGIAFSKSYVGYIHALAHSLGGKYGTPHGLANAVIMPYVLEAFGETSHKKLEELALFIGSGNKNATKRENAKVFIASIRELNKKMNIPDKVQELKEEDFDTLAERAVKEGNPTYPVPVIWEKEEFKEVLDRILVFEK